MRKLLFLALLCLLATGLFAQQQIIVGTGTEPSYSPVYYNYDYTQSEFLYKEADLTAAGLASGDEITELAFQANGDINAHDQWRRWTIRMKNTTMTAVSTETNGWTDPTTMEVVFGGGTGVNGGDDTFIGGNPQVVGNGGWFQITLTTHFTYDGGDLLIQARDHSTGWGSSNPLWRATTTSYVAQRYRYQDGNATLFDGATSDWGYSGSAQARPNIRFTKLVAVDPDDPPFPAALVSPANGATWVATSATLNWAASGYGNPPTGYIVKFGTEATPVTVVVDDDAVLTYEPTLTGNTTYYWRVIPLNGTAATTEAECPIWSFTTAPANAIQIGTDTTQSYAPLNAYYNYTVSQMIWTNTELEAAGFSGGQITHIGFQLGTGGVDLTHANDNVWYISMGEVEQSTFASTAPGDRVPLEGLQEVKNGQVANAVFAAGDWVNITLDEPFVYTGTNNLIIYINEYTQGYSNSTSTYWNATNAGANRVAWAYKDDGGPNNAYVPFGIREWSYSSNGVSPNRPNIRISYEAASNDPDLGITSFTGPAVIPGATGLNVTVTNTGGVAVNAGDYSVAIHRVDGGTPSLLTTIPGTEPLATGYASYTYTVSAANLNGLTLGAAGATTIRATLTYSGDTNANNNVASYEATIRPEWDVQAVSITAPGVIPTAAPMTITVANNGRAAMIASDYTVTVKANTTVLGTVDSLPIPVGEEVEITVPVATINNWTYSSPSFTFNVELTTTNAGDIGTNNTATASNSTLNFADADAVVEVGIGGTATSYSYPFNMYWWENLTQSIYHPEDFGVVIAGYIHAIYYKLTLGTTNNIGDTWPVNVYMANAVRTNGFEDATDYVPGADFTCVVENYDLFAGLRPLTIGQTYDIWIPLSEPFFYEGDDLVIMTHKKHTNYPGTQNVFFQTADGAHTMTLGKQQDSSSATTPYNPADPGENGNFNTYANRPQMRFVFTYGGYGELSGTITEANTTTGIQGVTVRQGTATTTSGADGTYILPMVNYTDTAPDVTFTKLGYGTVTIAGSDIAGLDWTSNEGEAVLDIEMTALTPVTVSGMVTYIDTNEPVTGAVVVIEGFTALAATGADGLYALTGAAAGPYPGETYQVTVARPADSLYESFEAEMFIDPALVDEDTNVFNFPIKLVEKTPSPKYVSSSVLENGTREVRWFDPNAEVAQYELINDFTYMWTPGGAITHIAAHRYTSTLIGAFDAAGSYLVEVSFMPYVSAMDFTVVIWTGDPGFTPNVATPTYTQALTSPTVGQEWNDIILDTPLLIPSNQDVVIGISAIDRSICAFYGGSASTFSNGQGDYWYTDGAWTTIFATEQDNDCWVIGTTIIYPLDRGPAPVRSLALGNLPSTNAPSSGVISEAKRLGSTPNTTIASRTARYASNNTREFNQKYNVYRLIGNEPFDPEDMSPLNVSDFVSGSTTTLYTAYADPATISQGFRYAVTAVYQGAGYPQQSGVPGNNYIESTPTISSLIGAPPTYTLTVNVSAEGGGSVIGTTIIANPSNQTTMITSGSSATLTLAQDWAYTIEVHLAGYLSQYITAQYSANTAISVTMSQSLLLFSNDFNNGLPAGWTSLDYDNDGYWWSFAIAGYNTPAAFSESRCRDTGECVYPDNWLITPAIHLPEEATTINMSAWAAPSSRAKPNERIFVYYTTAIAGMTPHWNDFIVQRLPNDPDMVWSDETLATNASRLSEERFNADNYNWKNIGQDLSLLAGETIWLAFRHAHSRDMDILKLSDITIVCEGGNTTAYTIGGTVSVEGVTDPLTGLTVSFTNIGNPSATVIDATVAANGTYSTTVPIGYYSVRVHGTANSVVYDYLMPNNLTVTANNPNFNITVPQMFTVSGTVSMFVSGGEPTALVGATVTLTNQAAGGYSPLPATTAATTGGFSILTTPGTYTLTVGYTPQDGTPQTWTHYANVVVDDADVTVTVLVNAVYTVTGTLHTGENPAVPVVGTDNVTLTRAGQTTPTYFASSVATTGVFTFPAVAPGTYTLKAAGNHVNASHPYDYEHDTPIVVTNANIPTIAIVITDLSDGDISAIPTVTTLKANYPNPFNPSTTIAFDVASAGRVSIEIYNIKGQRVKSLVNDSFSAGRHNVVWNGDDAAGHAVGSGVYFYRMTAPGYSSVRKMLLMK